MIIDHPLLGPRDSAEFTYLGDASLINRPDWQAEDAVAQFTTYGFALRTNPTDNFEAIFAYDRIEDDTDLAGSHNRNGPETISCVFGGLDCLPV